MICECFCQLFLTSFEKEFVTSLGKEVTKKLLTGKFSCLIVRFGEKSYLFIHLYTPLKCHTNHETTLTFPII